MPPNSFESMTHAALVQGGVAAGSPASGALYARGQAPKTLYECGQNRVNSPHPPFSGVFLLFSSCFQPIFQPRKGHSYFTVLGKLGVVALFLFVFSPRFFEGGVCSF